MSIAREHWLGLTGAVMLACGTYFGLVVAPPEKFMGDVGRIYYIHVPTAVNALLLATVAAVFAMQSLLTRKPIWDALLESTVEVAALYMAMLLIQGSIWAKPTWGVYWDWDPRLTTTAILLALFVSVLALRAFVPEPDRRARWSAVATIIAFVDVPIVYFSVKWWKTLHQGFTSSRELADTMKLPARLDMAALALIAVWLIARRTRIALRTAPRPKEPAAGRGLVAGVET
jgi:heme exporter protein C